MNEYFVHEISVALTEVGLNYSNLTKETQEELFILYLSEYSWE